MTYFILNYFLFYTQSDVLEKHSTIILERFRLVFRFIFFIFRLIVILETKENLVLLKIKTRSELEIDSWLKKYKKDD